ADPVSGTIALEDLVDAAHQDQPYDKGDHDLHQPQAVLAMLDAGVQGHSRVSYTKESVASAPSRRVFHWTVTVTTSGVVLTAPLPFGRVSAIRVRHSWRSLALRAVPAVGAASRAMSYSLARAASRFARIRSVMSIARMLACDRM